MIGQRTTSTARLARLQREVVDAGAADGDGGAEGGWVLGLSRKSKITVPVSADGGE